MADVGVLNLKVNAEGSDKATQSLRQLAGALYRVKNAVQGGIKLVGIGTSIEKFVTKINKAVNNDTISKIRQLGEALQSLNKTGSLSNVTINIKDGNISSVRNKITETQKAMQALRSEIESHKSVLNIGLSSGNLSSTEAEAIRGRIAELEGELSRLSPSAEKTGEAMRVVDEALSETTSKADTLRSEMQDVADAAERFANRMAQSNSLTVNVGWQFGKAADETERFASALNDVFVMMNRMRMASSIGAGQQAPLLGNAIPAEGWVEQDAARIGDISPETGLISIANTLDDTRGKLEDFERTNFIIAAGFKRVWDEASRSFINVAYSQEEFTQRVSDAASIQAQMDKEAALSGGSVQTAYGAAGSTIDEVKEKLKDFAWLLGQIPEAARGIGMGFSNLLKPVTSLIKQFGRIAKYRAIRAIIKSITDGFSEGVENVYRYSQAIGSSFSMAMDDAASSLQTMRNSIGAAVAPLIQALIPVLQTVVRWFITVINYVNQFFALLRGQATWTHAVDATTSAYEDQTSAAQGASAAVKDLLADWDELNIIQSESGGGGGGGAASEAEDYLNMFEELATFDNRIKKIVDYIKDHAAEILDIVKAIGVAILGWKISKAFEGLLGDIGRLIAGGALVYVSLKLGFASGFHAGQNGYFSEEDILGSILSDIAGLIGGYLLAGPAGAGVGLAVPLTAQLIGYIEGAEDRKDMLKWGEGSLTPEKIEAYVTSLFAFDITARMHVLEGVIQDQKTARTNLNRTIKAFGDSLNDVVLGVTVDGSPQGIIKAGKAAKELIDQINKNLRTSEKNIEVLTKIKPLGNEDGTGSILDGLKIADKTMSEYFTGIGEEIAHWIDEGQKSEWKNNEAQMALELMKHQQNILDQAEQNKIHRDFQVDSEINLAGLSRGTVEKVFDKEVEMINQYEEKYRTALENQAKELFYYADLADAAGLKDGEGNPLGNVYRSAADGLLEQIKSGKYMEELQPTLDLMRTQWIEALKKVYGEDVSKHVKVEALTHMDFGIFGKTTPRLEQVIGDSYRKALFDLEHGGTAGGMQLVKDALEEELWKAFDTIDPDGIARKAAKNFNISIFDLLGEDALSHLVQSTLNAVNNDTNAAYQILSSLGIDSAKIAEAMKLSILDGTKEGAAEAQNAAQESLADNLELSQPDIGGDHASSGKGWFASLFDSIIGSAKADEPEIEYAVEVVEDPSVHEPISAPGVDNTEFNRTINERVETARKAAIQIQDYLSMMGGFAPMTGPMSGYRESARPVLGRAAGGAVRSGDLVMANENGNFEMMGRMGHQPVVANNQQIVDGISRGVTNANGNVVTEMRTMVTLMQRLLNKEIVAKAVPSSGWGRNNSKSAEAYSKVTG